MEVKTINKKENLIFLFICFILVFLVYSQSLFGDFVFDDRSIVSYQAVLENINNLPEVLTMGYWTEESGLYRPVVLLSYAFNYWFLGPSPFWFHLINLILYVLTGYLLFLLLKKISPQRKLLVYLAPLLFLVLPIHTEAIANIVGRAEILALLFSLLALRELVKKESNLWKAGLWFILALGSKEVAIAVLPLAWWVIFIKKQNLKSFYQTYLAPLFILITSISVYLAARFFVLGGNFLSTNATLVENPLKFVSFGERFGTGLKILVIYLKKSFWPFQLCSDYSFNQISVVGNFLNPETLLGLAILLYLVISSIIFLGRAPVLALGSALFLFGFLPVSNLVFPIGTIAGERLMFFPSVGLCLYLAQFLIFLSRIKPRKVFLIITFILFTSLIGFYGTISFIRSLDWLTEKALFISAGQCASNSVLSRSNLATVYYFEGDYDKSLEENLVAQQIYDKYTKAINNLGLIYWKQGEFEKAKQEYFRAIKTWPPYEGVYENLILLELSQNNIEQAKKWISVIFAGDQPTIDIYLKRYGLK